MFGLFLSPFLCLFVCVNSNNVKLIGDKIIKTNLVVRRPDGTCELLKEIMIDSEKKIKCEEERILFYYTKTAGVFTKAKQLYIDELSEIHAMQSTGEYCRNVRRQVFISHLNLILHIY